MGQDEAKFSPASYEGKPKSISRKHRAALDAFWAPMVARIEAMSHAELGELVAACHAVSPANCGWHYYGIARLVHGSARARMSRPDVR